MKLKSIAATVVYTAIASSFANFAHAQSETLDRIKSAGAITIGYRESSIPFSYLGADQQPIGFSLDLCADVIGKIKAKLGLPDLKINLTPVNSSNRIPLIQNGTVDLECGSTAVNAKRLEQVSFSVATFMVQPSWLVKTASGIEGARDLAGKTVVVTQGSNAVGFAQELNGKDKLGLNIIQAKDHAESFLTLNTGRAVAFLEDDILLAGFRAASDSPSSLTLVEGGFGNIPYALMFSKGDAEFKQLVDGALSEKMASGEFTKLYDKWFTQPIPPRNENLEFPMGAALKERVAKPSDSIE
ncbi:putative ABC transporter substrate-binding protein (plasmid) [Sinorhizobium fredii HH103]|uniref:ABC transporter substrate-binding protein n=1 Tax=Sinorhizobium fredii (strain HH103) TaxID=1117943 RepID=G9AIS9_SINF1|nr:amino acid ABC transporter substrate-binding protein [Sinorhizobium fredii]CCF00961.1 putative ABC transporter substrate-binding protein [Sinorhizobium fredii HH103]